MRISDSIRKYFLYFCDSVAHVLTSSVGVQVQNRPSSQNIAVQMKVGRLTARGLDHYKSGEGGEGPIIVFSKHTEEGRNYSPSSTLHTG